jgi:chromosome segregation ATPase
MRQDLEDLHEVMIDQKEQFRKLQEQLSKSDSASKDQDELAVRCKELDHKAIQLEEALEQERTKYKESTAKLLDLKRKHKQLDEVHNKMKNSVVPKVTATKEYHKELAGHIS